MKQELKIYKLHFTSSLHIASSREDYGISQTTISSDTMYAALTACLAKLGEPIPQDGDLGCTISSLFPFYQKDDKSKAVLFFPRPLLTNLPPVEPTKHKAIKKVTWLSDNAFQNMLADGVQILSQDKYKIIGKYLVERNFDFGKDLNKQECIDFCQSQVSERVTIKDRTGQSDAEPFYMDRISFKDHSGLFFVVEGETDKLEKAIRLLSLEGIGTDRNVGNGFFEYEQDTITLDLPNNTDYIISLSCFLPESKAQLGKMLSSDKSAYELQRRGGWITTSPNQSLRKNVIYMLAAGSVLKNPASDVCVLGRIVDLRPELAEVKHPIWRNGKALFIPIKM